MILLDKKAYGKITMRNIAKKAGIARQTLYLRFKNKDDIVSQFLIESEKNGLMSIERESNPEPKSEKILITFNTEFVVEHYGILKKMLADKYIHNLIMRMTREKVFTITGYYEALLTPQEYAVCKYKLAYQLAGFFATLVDWFNADMPQPLNELICMLNAIAQPAEKTWQNLPNIELRST
ncbi:MAG: TetR/AcrR family transcriptional regulator [Spirochaetaceae bacterium]|jgi:AcrR family transcriptional regulator|nr:TetR/AcrR family transcriptional regulator [Spirochaetaceae bacterium]